MSIDNYSIEEHTHRFGLWTAARAASTSRFSNSEVAAFIKESKLKEALGELQSSQEMNHEIYKDWFIRRVNSILAGMSNYINVNDKKRKKIFGIAAKIVSIYVKTVEIIPSKGNSKISHVAFPPIDRFLLAGLKEKLKIKNISWSNMEEEEYMKLIGDLKELIGDKPFWTLEYYWDLNKNADVQTPNL